MRVIETENLSCVFQGGRRAVRAIDGLSLCVETGPPIGLVGPNGAGKTTLFSLLCGFEKPTSGSVRVMGCAPEDAELRGQVAILPQDAQLHRGLAIGKQLAFLAELQGFSRAASQQETVRVLGQVDMVSFVGRRPETLSHGMLKRVLLAQALIGEPKLLLLDEPTSGLDPQVSGEIRQMIREVGERRTVMVSSHNLKEIEDLCHSVVVLKQGRLCAHRPIEQLIDETETVTVDLTGRPSAEALAALANLSTVTAVDQGPDGPMQLVISYTDDVEILAVLTRVLADVGVGIKRLNRGRPFEKTFTDLVSK